MNSSQRHELAEREESTRWEAYGWTVLRLSTKAPADLLAIGPDLGGGIRFRLIEVKTGSGRLSKAQRALKGTFPAHYLVSRYEVVNGRVSKRDS